MEKNHSLLIIGAGGHGKVVEEIASSLEIYQRIAFVDDNLDKDPSVLGPIAKLDEYLGIFSDCIVSIGNNKLRAGLLSRIKEIGFSIPILIHPKSYVSTSAKIGEGTVIEANVGINSNAIIGQGCILSIGSLVDHNGIVEDYCHLDVGAIVKTNGIVEKGSHVDSGNVVFGKIKKERVYTSPDVDKDEEWVRKYLKDIGSMPTFF